MNFNNNTIKQIVCLNDNYESLSKESIGTKSYNLNILYKKGFLIPTSYVLSIEYLQTFLRCNNIEKLIEEIIESTNINGNDIGANLYKIEKYIRDSKFTDDMLAELKEIYIKYFHGKKLAVRSSSINEDNCKHSFAGLYKSYLGISSFDEMLNAIKDVWISAYSIEVVYYCKKNYIKNEYRMAVLIQEMIDIELGGVLFTKDPTLPVNKGLIEMVEGSVDNLVSGSSSSKKLYFDRETGIIETNSFDFLQTLSIDSLKAEAIFRAPVDIEWGLYNKQIYFLQVRPITTSATQRTLKDIKTADIDSLEQINNLNLNDAKGIFDRWMIKKYHIRNQAIRSQINVYKGYYVEFTHNLICKNIDFFQKFLNGFDTEYLFVDVNMNLKGQIILRSKLIEFILTFTKNEKDTPHTIRVRECIPTEIGGISSLCSSGEIYIEYARGGLMGFGSGYFSPSSYIVNQSGLIIKHQLCRQDIYYSIDDNLSFTPKKNDQHEISLTEKQIQEVINMTTVMAERFGEVRVEWYIYNGKLYFSDLSIEKNEISLDNDNSRIVISSGYVKGKILVIPELKELEYYSHGYAISINKTEEFYEAQKSSVVQKLIQEIEREAKGEPIILVTKHPYAALSLLFDYIDGFIFTEGSILAHLSILLREEGKPSIIDNNAFEHIKNNEYYELYDNNLIKLQNLM